MVVWIQVTIHICAVTVSADLVCLVIGADFGASGLVIFGDFLVTDLVCLNFTIDFVVSDLLMLWCVLFSVYL